MGARSGNNYLSSLKKLGAEIFLGGERVSDVTTHRAFRNCAQSLAQLYDMQSEHPEAMTFRTDDGGRAGLSFHQPRTPAELAKRSRMMKTWADFSGGFMGRTPDYLNVSITAMAAHTSSSPQATRASATISRAITVRRARTIGARRTPLSIRARAVHRVGQGTPTPIWRCA